MTQESLKFQMENEDENVVALTLSKSARISLTDIAAATIGNLSEESQWEDNSVSATDANLPVLRPWEDNYEPDKSGAITQNMRYPERQLPSYHEHQKRKLDDDVNREEVSKRYKTDPTPTNTEATVLYSYIMPGTNVHHSQQDGSQDPLLHTTQKNVTQQAYNHVSLQTIPQQSYLPASINQTSMQGAINQNTTHNSKLRDTSQNSLQTVISQISEQEVIQNVTRAEDKHQHVTVGQTSLPAEPSSNTIYFPWTNNPVLQEKKNFQNVQQDSFEKQYMEQISQPTANLWTKTSDHAGDKLPFLFRPHNPYPVATSRQQKQLIQPATVTWQPQFFPSEQHNQATSAVSSNDRQSIVNSQTIPSHLQMSDILQTSIADSTTGNSLPTPWQQATEVQKKTFEIKEDPSTPVGKGHMTFSKYDSPGIDSRFTESLSSLLGSPPPDSPLSKNPFLGDLQALLNRECKREIVPQSLFGIQSSNKENRENKVVNVFERERNLQERFTNLQSSHPEDTRQLSSMFRYQSALIETERFRTLHECQYPGSYKESVNRHYDNQLHKVMDRVEKSVELLEISNKENKLNKATKLRPHLSKDAVRLMEAWYQQNLNHPYPTNTVIEMLAHAGNIGIEQVKKWFANKRNRSSNTRSLTEIAMQKRKLGQMP